MQRITQLNNYLELLLKLYPILLSFFFLLDLVTFHFLFNFKIGYLSEIFSDINLFSLNFIFLLLFIPISFIIIFSLGLLLSNSLIKILLHNRKFYYFIKKLYFWKSLLSSIGILILYYICTYYLLIKGGNGLLKDELIFFLFLIFSSSSIIGFLYSISIIEEKNKYPNNPKNSIKRIKVRIIIFSLVILSSFIILILISNSALKLISLFLVIYVGIFLIKPTKNITNKNNKKKTNYIMLPFLIITIFAYIEFSNKNIWKQEISDKSTALPNLSFNLIFNKGLLLKNKNEIEIKLPYKYYEPEVKNYCKEKLPFYDKNNKNICNFIQNNKEYPLNSTNIKLLLDNKYWYLNVSKNIKMYFTNLGENNKKTKKFQANGLIIFLIKEKEFSNKKGSESLLLATSKVLF